MWIVRFADASSVWNSTRPRVERPADGALITTMPDATRCLATSGAGETCASPDAEGLSAVDREQHAGDELCFIRSEE